MSCKHPAQSLGWVKADSWGCRLCGHVVFTDTASTQPWYRSRPNVLSFVTGLLAVILAFAIVVMLSAIFG